MTDWIIQFNGVSTGPVSASELKRMAASGKIYRSTLLRREGSDAWTPAEKIKGLFPETDGLDDSPSSLRSAFSSTTGGGSSATPEMRTTVGSQAEAVVTYSPPASPQAISNQQSTSGKRRYRMIEIYAAVFRVLGAVVAVCGILAAMLTVAFDPVLLDSLALAFGIIIGSALIAFSLLLSSQMIKLVLDIAGDIKQIADRAG
jgi:hypothetical protein